MVSRRTVSGWIETSSQILRPTSKECDNKEGGGGNNSGSFGGSHGSIDEKEDSDISTPPKSPPMLSPPQSPLRSGRSHGLYNDKNVPLDNQQKLQEGETTSCVGSGKEVPEGDDVGNCRGDFGGSRHNLLVAEHTAESVPDAYSLSSEAKGKRRYSSSEANTFAAIPAVPMPVPEPDTSEAATKPSREQAETVVEIKDKATAPHLALETMEQIPSSPAVAIEVETAALCLTAETIHNTEMIKADAATAKLDVATSKESATKAAGLRMVAEAGTAIGANEVTARTTAEEAATAAAAVTANWAACVEAAHLGC